MHADSIPSSSAIVRLQLLGDFAVVQNRAPLPVRRCSQRLLAFLGLSQRPVARSRVAGTLWPESGTGQASANLRAALSRLPRPGGFSLTSSGTTELALSEHVEVDIWLSYAHIRELKTPDAPPLQDPDDDPHALLSDDVLPLWDDDWVLVERERHRQARLHALERLSTSLLIAGRWEEALEAALAAVAGEPLRESAHRRVIEVHLAERNPAEALRQYAIYRQVLRAELGLAPSAELRLLLRPLLQRPEDTVAR